MVQKATTRLDKAIQRHGPAELLIEFKKDKKSREDGVLNILPNQINDFSITLDINRFLPSFKLSIQDELGYFTHMIPFDRRASKMFVRIKRPSDSKFDNSVEYDFDVYKKTPNSGLTYTIEGLLSISNLFSPDKYRGFSGSIKTTIETIAGEFGVDDSEVSKSLDYSKNIVQPGWSNGLLLKYLGRELIGKSREVSFFSYVKMAKTKKVFVFKAIKDFQNLRSKYIFNLSTVPFYDREADVIHHPILDYEIVDNYKTIGISGSRRQHSLYFDYDNSTYKSDIFELQGDSNPKNDYQSLTGFYLIDQDDNANDNIGVSANGRNNSFTDFSGRTLGSFHKAINNLSKVWITSWFLEDLYPGDIVEIGSIENFGSNNAIGAQYQGFWMVERVIHILNNVFFSKILLTRNGVTVTETNSLLQATKRKRT